MVEPNAQTFQALAGKLEQSQSPNAQERKQAEDFLRSNEHLVRFPEVLLRFLELKEVSVPVRQSAAVFLKRFVERNWSEVRENENAPEATTEIRVDDRNFIKANVVPLMLSSPGPIQVQLSGALEIISKHDFPDKWPNLMPQLVEKLVQACASGDFNVVCGVLTTCNSIFARYRHEMRSDKLWTEIGYVISKLGAPLLKALEVTILALEAHKSNLQALKPVVKAAGLICQAVHSLIYQEFADFFESTIGDWFKGFQILLTYSSSVLPHDDDDDIEGSLEFAKAEICRTLAVFVEKYDDSDAVKAAIPVFVKLVWELLTTTPNSKFFDDLVTSAMSLLTGVVTKKWWAHIFDKPEVHKEICERIIIPNIRLRESDVDEFEFNPLEYLRRDMEGSDTHTRRREAVDLVQGLCKFYKEQISAILFGYITTLIKEYEANKENNWFAMDAAIFLVLAVAVTSQTERRGAITINPLVNVGDFLAKYVLPELQDQDIKSRPILRADCIKFVLMFRSHLPDDMFLKVVGLMARFLQHEEFVVHSYAARAVEKMLSLKKSESSRETKVSAAALQPMLKDLLNALFSALQFSDSHENPYIMRAITRVCVSAEGGLVELGGVVLDNVVQQLDKVAKNPVNPTFNHYLFETISASIKSVCAANKETVKAFEGKLFPVFETILNLETCPEFRPYVFQLIGQMLRARGSVTQEYLKLFPALVNPELWRDAGNVRPLTNLLSAFLRYAGNEIVNAGKVEPLLGVFQKLLSMRGSDAHAFAIVQAVLEFLPKEITVKYHPTILRLVFQKLQADKSPRYVRNFCIFCNYFIVVSGFETFLKAIDSVQQGILSMIVQNVWLKNVAVIDTELGRKICVAGIVTMICDAKFVNSPYFDQLFSPLLRFIIEIFTTQPTVKQNDDEELEELERAGYNAQYAHLAYARDEEHDPVAKIKSVREYFGKKLEECSQQFPGKLNALNQGMAANADLNEHLKKAHMGALKLILQDAKARIH